MNKTSVLTVLTSVVLAGICGCGEKKGPATTGFLSDYSKLKAASDDSYRYLDKPAVANYKAYIVDPVQTHFVEGTNAIKEKSEGKITDKELTDLTNYFHSALIKAITDSGRQVVYQAGPGVARIRVALTDLKETGALNVLPQASLLGVGAGEVAMEAEVVDSVTGKQLAAVVETGKGGRIPFSNLGEWGTAKGIFDGWAKRLKERLDEAGGQ